MALAWTMGTIMSTALTDTTPHSKTCSIPGFQVEQL